MHTYVCAIVLRIHILPSDPGKNLWELETPPISLRRAQCAAHLTWLARLIVPPEVNHVH